MSLWKRAILYLTRKKGRSLLLTALLFLMCCSVIVGLFLKKNADGQMDSLRRSLGSGFILEADTGNELYQERVEDAEGNGSIIYAGPMITDEMIGKIMELDGVKDYLVSTLDVVWTSLELRKGAWGTEEDVDEEENERVRAMGGWTITQEELDMWRQTTLANACRSGELHTNFRTGALTISEGRNIQTEDSFKAVISEEMAERNQLSVGDTITVVLREGEYQSSKDPMKVWGEPLELQIVGLFHINFAQASSEYTAEEYYLENNIYTDWNTHLKMDEYVSENWGQLFELVDGYTRVTFFVEDPGELDSIMDMIKNQGVIDMDAMSLTADNTAYQSAISPYKTIRVFSMVLLAAGIAGIGLILFLVMRLWVQGRKHEAGVLVSIGIGKKKIVLQMLAEGFLVCAVALLLSFALLGPLVDGCSRMAEQLTTPAAEREAYQVNTERGFPEAIKVSADAVELERSISVDTVLLVILLVFGVSGISVLMAATKLTGIEPKEVIRFM